MWLALVLPFLVLPALLGLSRYEQRVMGGPVTVPHVVQGVRDARPAPHLRPR